MLRMVEQRSQAGGAGVPLLQLRELTKRYPGVLAVDHVDLDVGVGEGHALVGENGAGKSTVLKMIGGLTTPDSGDIELDGTPVTFHHPRDARHHGISFVPQELSLVGDLTIAENVFLGQIPRKRGLVDRSAIVDRTRQLLDRLGVAADPRSKLSAHSPAVQQLVMIARGIALSGRLFILDEPTAALSDREITHLFGVLAELREQGASYLYVSHRLEELPQVADRITVLRDGKVVTTAPMQQLDEAAIVKAMVGREITSFFGVQRAATGPESSARPPALSVRKLTRSGTFSDISFDVGRGEIVGLAGLMGAGRTEIAHAVFGVAPADSGTIEVDGRSVRIRSPRDAVDAGIVLAPEERKSMGLVLGRSISDNVALPALRALSIGRVLRGGLIHRRADTAMRDLRIKAPSTETTVSNLSGGNQQKVVLAKWLAGEPLVYIFDEPTRGIDVDVKSEIYGILAGLADRGAAVLMISSEMNELLAVTDRIVVIRGGEVAGEVPAAEATGEKVLSLAMGVAHTIHRQPPQEKPRRVDDRE